jgi:Copper chaperone
MKQNIIIEGMSCGHCTGSVEKALKGIAGVTKVKVDLDSKTAAVESDLGISEELLKSTISDLGFSVTGLAQA